MVFEEYKKTMNVIENNLRGLQTYLEYMDDASVALVTGLPEELSTILNEYSENRFGLGGNLKYNLKDDVIRALFDNFVERTKIYYKKDDIDTLVSRMVFPITLDTNSVESYDLQTLIDIVVAIKTRQAVNEILDKYLEVQRNYYSNESTVTRILEIEGN